MLRRTESSEYKGWKVQPFIEDLEYTIEQIREKVIRPENVVKKLNDYIIGQDSAKKVLAIAAMNREIRLLQRDKKIKFQDIPFDKSNVLFIGPTGTGKTALIKAYGKVLGVPVTIADISGTTSSGYVGKSAADVLATAYSKIAREGAPKTHEEIIKIIETSIIYIDEIDKICKGGDHYDITGTKVQHELLQILEGSQRMEVELHNRSLIHLNTADILFICGGAFSGLDQILKKRLGTQQSAGFTAQVEDKQDITDLFSKVINEDLINYGFIPELLGRLPLRASFSNLGISELKQILTEPRDSLLKHYTAFFEVFGIQLLIDEEVLNIIANKALEIKTGARALRGLMRQLFEPYLYNIFQYENLLRITKEDAEKLLK